jgi:hypothetical protein
MSIQISDRGRCGARPLFFAVSLIVGTSLAGSALAAEGRGAELWQFGAPDKPAVTQTLVNSNIRAFGVFMADRAQLEAALSTANVRMMAGAAPAERILDIPLPDGSFMQLEVWEHALLSPEMQARHPDIRTYRGRGIDDPTITAALDLTSRGFHGQVITSEGTLLINPVQGASDTYMSFWKHDAEKTESFSCGVGSKDDGDPLHVVRSVVTPLFGVMANPSGTQLTTYRLRIVTTRQYTEFFADPAAAVVTTVNRMDGIYEREVSIRFNLISTDNLTGNESDYPFEDSPSVNSAFLTQNNDWLNTTYGVDSYDIGHVFGAGGGGGLAERPSVCTATKGRGGTQLSNPSGDVFDVDYVSHEIGHQMGGEHTFNGTSDTCGTQRAAQSAYEPGSGSTIMAYAGICSGQNVQSNSDAYFHTRSFDQITGIRDSAGCGTVTDTGNLPPSVNAGPDRTVPQGTPFRLTATGSDPNVDPVTYNWEQFDLGPATGIPTGSSVTGPLFRSRFATTSPTRTFPRFEDILSPPSTSWEVLPTVDRTMNFRVTARDGRGGVRYDSTVVEVQGAPFRVTDPGTQECALPTSLSWEVGGGSIAPNVRVSYSTDNGTSFSSLLDSTSNDGSEEVNLPNVLTTNNSRIMIEALDPYIFFSVSGRFSVVDTTPPVVTPPANVTAECSQKNPPGTPLDEVTLGMATALDSCEGPKSVSNNAPLVFLLGDNTVTWSAADSSGNTGAADQTVTVEDTIPPTISVTLSPTVIWAPNHKMEPITATVTVDDVCDPDPAIRLVSITSNEPANALGDGNFAPDFEGADFGTADFGFLLRAERSGRGSGRTYTVTYEVEDASGNKASAQATVFVPRDQR